MSWWSKEKDGFLRQALICANREELRASRGFLTWEQVAERMHQLEGTRTLGLVKKCYDRYHDHLIFTMEDVDHSNFALRYPPWRTKEFEHLRSIIHHTVPGGKSGDPKLSWDKLTNRMNEAHIIIDDFTGVPDTNYFSRTYCKRDIFLAWRTRILPHSYGSGEPGAGESFPIPLDMENPTSRDEYLRHLASKDLGAQDQSSQIQGAKDERTYDKPPRYSKAGHRISKDQEALNMPPPQSLPKKQGPRELRPRRSSGEHQGVYSATYDQRIQDQHLNTQQLPQKIQSKKPQHHNTSKQAGQGARHRHPRLLNQVSEDIYSATDEPEWQEASGRPVMTSIEPHDRDFLDPGEASSYPVA